LDKSYFAGMTVRVGEKGQVVIPKAIRDVVGIEPGDEVDFELRDGEVVLVQDVRMRDNKPLGGRFAGSGIDSAALLLEDRRREPR
jgi:antitoxin PrlF